MPKKRTKADAVPALQTDKELDRAVEEMGRHQRTLAVVEKAMQDELAAAKRKYETGGASLKDRLTTLQRQIQNYAETNRNRLTQSGRRKSLKLPAGRIGWRATPPKVTLKGVDQIIQAIRDSRLSHVFLRVKTEVNKEALLAHPGKAAKLPGVTIGSKEEFFIEPFTAELAEAADD